MIIIIYKLTLMCLVRYFVGPIMGFGGFRFLVWSDVLIMAETKDSRVPAAFKFRWLTGENLASTLRTSLETTYGMTPTPWHPWITGHLRSQLLLSWTLCCPWVLPARDSSVQLGESLCIGEGVLLISILSSSSWQTATSIFCRTVKDCNSCNQR